MTKTLPRRLGCSVAAVVAVTMCACGERLDQTEARAHAATESRLERVPAHMRHMAPIQPWTIPGIWLETRGVKKTVEGNIVDLNCYVEHAGFGSEHRNCAATCARSGLPMGFMDRTGTTYLISGPGHVPLTEVNRILASHVESTVLITGYFFEEQDLKLLAVERLTPASEQWPDDVLQRLYRGMSGS